MRIAVCDDQEVILCQVENIIKMHEKELDVSIQVDLYSNLKDFNSEVEVNVPYDLVFMDIEVGDDNGIAAAERLMEISPLTIIVFMTAYDSYMVDTFKARPLGFVKKPVEHWQINKYVDKVISMMEVQDYFSYAKGKREYKVALSEIYYLESFGRKVRIHSRNVEDECYGKLNEMEQELIGKSKKFVRINQSYIVNTSYMISKEKDNMSIRLKDDSVTLPISRSYSKSVNKWYMEHMFNK